MAHTLACDGQSGVTAIAALAGALPSRTEDCAPPRPVSVLQIQGTLDLVIAYGGLSGSYPSVDTNMERWRLYNRCKGTPVAGEPKDYDFATLGAETHPLTSAACAADTTVTLWRMDGGGHLPVPMPDFVPDLLTWLGTHGTTAPLTRD
jgi:poly(3-hydroxybutyrate) depolymerase